MMANAIYCVSSLCGCFFYAKRLPIAGNQMNFCQRWGIGATYKYLQGYL